MGGVALQRGPVDVTAFHRGRHVDRGEVRTKSCRAGTSQHAQRGRNAPGCRGLRNLRPGTPVNKVPLPLGEGAAKRWVRVEVTTRLRPSPNPLPEGEGFIDRLLRC